MTDVYKNRLYDEASPALSILIPFFKDDASALVSALATQKTSEPIEIIVVDDGTGDPVLTSRLQSLTTELPAAICLITSAKNGGRAAARNRLQQAARSDWLLFLDADMRPVSQNFLHTYLSEIERNRADIIFGGFTVESQSEDKSGALHRALSAVSDCLPLKERQAAGPQYVASSNLCLRKSVITENPFDNGFVGWGWEDSEWAARVSKSYTLIHIDNPALHLGLENEDTLLKRLQLSGPNYARFTDKHPELAKTLTLYRLSKRLRKVPGQKFGRPILRRLVKSNAPMRARLIALKLWRASWYAEALK